jgi:hypothetical protein
MRPVSVARDSAACRPHCEAARSRALLKLVEELCPGDLFVEFMGTLDRVPRRRWLQVIAIAVALRHSWSRDRLATVVRRLARVLWPSTRSTNPRLDATLGHHDADCSARRDPVKALRFAPTPYGAHGLDRLAVAPRDGIYVMAGGREGCSRQDRTMRDISPTPNIAMTIGGHLRIYYADVTTAGQELDDPSTMTLHASTRAEHSIFAPARSARPSAAHRRHGRTESGGCSRAAGLCRARAETAQITRQWLRNVSGKHGDERQVDG